MDDLTRLAISARDGDRAALAAFVRAAQIDVWRLCAHLGDPVDADDLTQDVLVRVISALHRFRAESSARTWVLAIARRACADEVRRRARRRRALGRVDPAPDATPDTAGDVELDLLLGVLDADRRAAFVLTQIVGLSYEEAAGACGCPVGTIRSRVARARAALVAALHASTGNRPAAAGDR